MPTTLVLTNDFPPRIGGIESFVAQVCRLLDDDVVVLASGPPGAAATDADRPFRVVRHGGLLLPTPAVAQRAARLLADSGATRVVVGAAMPLGLVVPALRRAGAETVVALTHGHEVWWATVPGARSALRRVGDAVDHLTTISDFTAARIAPALGDEARTRLRRLRAGRRSGLRAAPAGARQRPDRRAPPTVVAVGRFVAQKGFDVLLAAWAGVVAGLGPRRPAPGARRRRPRRTAPPPARGGSGARGQVTFTGALGPDAVAARLRAADVFALPVRTRLAGLNPEGLGLAALEAAACGLPVLVGRSGGAPETVLDGVTGHVLPSRDPSAWTRALLAAARRTGRGRRDGGAGPGLRRTTASARPAPGRRCATRCVSTPIP